MVKGLERFKENFQGYTDQFVLIGGTACDLIMTDAGLPFRATKDLDIVLVLEALSPAFVSAFWEFIRAGEYEAREKASGAKQYYRFAKPGIPEYPAMMELFSRIPDALSIADGSTLTPIPMDEEISSLSAILLDEVYYGFLQSGKKEISGLPIVGAVHLIALKAKAWMDLSERKRRGEPIDRSNIPKHKNDIFRLYQVVDPDFSVGMNPVVQADMVAFLRAMESDDVDLKSLGVRDLSIAFVLADIRRIFGM